MNKKLLTRLFDSRKFVVLLVSLVIVGVAVAFRQASFAQFVDFLKWATAAFALATGLEGPPSDGGGSSLSGGTTSAVVAKPVS